MANPRRSILQLSNPHQNPPPILPLSSPTTATSGEDCQQTHHHPSLSLLLPLLSSLASFLKRPQAFPILLSLFVLLTWLSLRLQHPTSSPSIASSLSLHPAARRVSPTHDADADANLVRFAAADFLLKDSRGWLLDPVAVAQHAAIPGGALFCASLHVGEIRPGGLRGNHRHHFCNETFVIWGAETKFRVSFDPDPDFQLENHRIEDKGYAEVSISADEVAVAVSPKGTAHALINIDSTRTTFLLGCQDSVIASNSSATDYNIWKDL